MERPRERSVVMTVVAAAASMAVFGLGTACATDQGITGKKLLMKTGKVVLLSKDPSISIAGSDPVGGSDSSVTFNDGSGPVPWSLPKTSWGKNGAGTLFKYKNAAAPSGPSSVKIAKLSSGLLKMVAKGVPFSVPNGAATVNIVFSLDGGTNAYCMTFSGTGDGNKFLVKDATAGTCPGGGAVCGNNIREGSEVCDGSDDTACPGLCQADCTCCTGQLVGGFCWFLGDPGATCHATCTDNGLACSVGTITYAGSGGTYEQCVSVMTALGVSDTQEGDVDNGNAIGCSDYFGIFRDTFPTTCSGATPAVRRACACDLAGAVCGNNVRQGTEACDGTDTTLCPGGCRADCTCAVCGNNVQEGPEACDGSDDTACPGMCTPACTCPMAGCPADDAMLCSLLSAASTSCVNCCLSDIDCTLQCMGGDCASTCLDDVRTLCALECCP